MSTRSSTGRNWEVAMREILQRPGARAAFQSLCKDGCEPEELACRILWLQEDKPSRNREVRINRRECRRIGKALARLVLELSDFPALYYRVIRELPTRKCSEQIKFTTKVRWRWKPPEPVRFNPITLHDQLRAGAEHLLRLAKQPDPVVCYIVINDFNLRRLLSYVREKSHKAHYKEIATLCHAVTHGHGVAALKQRVYQSRRK